MPSLSSDECQDVVGQSILPPLGLPIFLPLLPSPLPASSTLASLSFDIFPPSPLTSFSTRFSPPPSALFYTSSLHPPSACPSPATSPPIPPSLPFVPLKPEHTKPKHLSLFCLPKVTRWRVALRWRGRGRGHWAWARSLRGRGRGHCSGAWAWASA